MKVLLISKKMNADATGDYNPNTGELTVLKGSVLSMELSQSRTFRGRKSIEKAQNGVLKGNVLTQNVMFKSPSTAANFVTGGSSNGKRLWKTENGIAIGDLAKGGEPDVR